MENILKFIFQIHSNNRFCKFTLGNVAQQLYILLEILTQLWLINNSATSSNNYIHEHEHNDVNERLDEITSIRIDLFDYQSFARGTFLELPFKSPKILNIRRYDNSLRFIC